MAIYLDAYTKVTLIALCVGLITHCNGGSLQDQYIGCYQDVSSQSRWTNGIMNSDTLTIELCIETCRRQNSTYAVLQVGRNCLCGDTLSTSSPDFACDTRCSGNVREVCGGSSGSVSSYVIYSVCPVGYYGAGCDKACHCKQQIPCNFVTGICPNGCERNWTLETCSKETSQSLSDRRIGCYGDDWIRAMESQRDLPSLCTIELCSSVCASNNYTYAGIEFGYQCFCGDSYDKHGPRPDSSCNSACAGDGNEMCGGQWALSIYFACPIGYFGKDCMYRCNCKNEQRCTCANCTCSSGCKSGWMGSRCEIRNFSENNGGCTVNETCVTVNLKFASVNRCNCKQGYERNRLWDSCTAIDECKENICDRTTTNCTKTADGFACVCLIGYMRVNTTHCEDKPCNASKICEQQGFPLGVVVGASIGSAVASAVIAVSVVSAVICCRRRRQPSKKSEDAAENRRKEVTDEKVENPISLFAYATLNKMPKEDDSAYTELTGNENRPRAKEIEKRFETGIREQLPANEFDRDTSKVYEELG